MTCLDLDGVGRDDALEDELGDAVTLGHCEGVMRHLQRLARVADGHSRVLTFVVRVGQVEEEHSDLATVVGVNDTSADVNHELGSCVRKNPVL